MKKRLINNITTLTVLTIFITLSIVGLFSAENIKLVANNFIDRNDRVDIWSNTLYKLLNLDTKVLVEFEYWRFLTYPFITDNVLNLLFISTFGVYIFSKLERLVKSSNLLLFFGVFTVTFGFAYTISNFPYQNSISGLDSFFLFSLFLYTFMHSNSSFKNRFEHRLFSYDVSQNYYYYTAKEHLVNFFNKIFVDDFRVILPSVIILALWVTKEIFNAYTFAPTEPSLSELSNSLNTNTLNLATTQVQDALYLSQAKLRSMHLGFPPPSSSPAVQVGFNNNALINSIFTLLYALITSMILKGTYDKTQVYRTRPFTEAEILAAQESALEKHYQLQETSISQRARTTLENEMSYSAVSRLFKEDYPESDLDEDEIDKEINFLYDDKLSDEEKIDEILDRINEMGKENITNEELDFLKKYSDLN